MHRTEGQYNDSNMFANGPPGTRVEENWLNSIQEELAYVIEEASITLKTAATDTRTQLLQAMKVLFATIPTGTSMVFMQTTAPTGWTKVITHNNKALRVVSGSVGTGGSVPFTTAFANKTVSNTTATGTVGNTTLALSQVPNRTGYFDVKNADYGVTYISATSGVFSKSSGANQKDWGDHGGTSSAASRVNFDFGGGGGSHSHTFTGSAHNHTLDLAVQYVDVIIATKD